MGGDDDIENQKTQILNPVGYTYAEITKDEVFSLLEAFWLVSGRTDRPNVGYELRRLGIWQREPFVTWIREWTALP